MSTELKDKSISEVLVTSTDIIRKYRTLFDKILGSTPEEIRETQEALEGLTPAEIREAVKHYRIRTHTEIQEMPKILGGFTPIEIREALRNYRARHPKNM